MIVCFVDIGGIVDNDCLIVFFFIIYKIIEETLLLLCCVILVIYIKNIGIFVTSE